MEVAGASQRVAGLLAAGRAKDPGAAAGDDLVVRIILRLRKEFGSDARSLDALERARRDGSPAAVAELASALAWYARRDQAFADELATWALHGDKAFADELATWAARRDQAFADELAARLAHAVRGQDISEISFRLMRRRRFR